MKQRTAAFPLSPDRAVPPPWFWAFLDAVACDRTRVPGALAGLKRGAIGRLAWTFEWAEARVATDAFRDRCCPGESEDGVADAAEWIVCSGEVAYESAVRAPDATLCA